MVPPWPLPYFGGTKKKKESQNKKKSLVPSSFHFRASDEKQKINFEGPKTGYAKILNMLTNKYQ